MSDENLLSTEDVSKLTCIGTLRYYRRFEVEQWLAANLRPTK